MLKSSEREGDSSNRTLGKRQVGESRGLNTEPWRMSGEQDLRDWQERVQNGIRALSKGRYPKL